MASGIGRTSCVIHRHIRPAARQTTSRVRPRSIAAFQQIPPCIANTHQRSRFYGTKTEVNPLNEIVAPPLLRPYLRNCLTERGPGTPQSNLEFTISFLGTASGSSTMHRNGSCTALRLGGQTYLFDCAEGTIRQIIHSRISVGSITKIFISHLHGDHVYGLIPIILEVQVAMKLMKSAADANPKKSRRYKNRTVMDERPTLEIYGPPGLYNYVAMNMALSCTKVNYLNVVVTELVGGGQERGPMNTGQSTGMGNGRRGRRNVFLSHYPEVEFGLLTRKYLEMDKDTRTWTISSPKPVDASKIDAWTQKNGFHELPNSVTQSNREMHIKAAELDHLKGVQTFGYTVEEQTPPGSIDPEKAKALGIRPSKKYSLLKLGVPVQNDDNTALVEPKDVLIETFRARKFTFLADHRRVPSEMKKLSADSDVLIHEATLSIKDGESKIKIRGHNNAYNAGVAGRMFGCKVVALNHFASLITEIEHVEEVVEEAQSGNKGTSQIVASYDFMELWIPRGGFKFDENDKVQENRQKPDGTEPINDAPAIAS